MEIEIKVGDIVYVKETVIYGWNKGRSFFVPKKVERLTKTLFVVEGGRKFNKKDLREYGERQSRAYFEGHKLSYTGGEVVKDQTEEMQDFKMAIALEQALEKVLEPLSGTNISYVNLPIEVLRQALDKANELSKLLKQE